MRAFNKKISSFWVRLYFILVYSILRCLFHMLFDKSKTCQSARLPDGQAGHPGPENKHQPMVPTLILWEADVLFAFVSGAACVSRMGQSPPLESGG